MSQLLRFNIPRVPQHLFPSNVCFHPAGFPRNPRHPIQTQLCIEIRPHFLRCPVYRQTNNSTAVAWRHSLQMYRPKQDLWIDSKVTNI